MVTAPAGTWPGASNEKSLAVTVTTAGVARVALAFAAAEGCVSLEGRSGLQPVSVPDNEHAQRGA